jgi:hypothetical protein
MTELLLIFVAAFVLSWIPPLVKFLRSRRQFSGARNVLCPETHGAATIRLDASHAASSGLTGEPDLRVASCSLGRVGQCSERCVGENEAAILEGASRA